MLSFHTNPIKHQFNRLALALLIYELIFQIGGYLILLYHAGLRSYEGLAMLLAGFLALFAATRILGMHPVGYTYERFHAVTYLKLLFLVYGLQAYSTILLDPVEKFLKSMGFSLEYATEAATGSITGFWMLIYSILAAPILEECLFRGLIYGSLRRYGKIFAVLISAFLFGLMHGNIIQFFTALLIGGLFAWIRETYGLPCSILMHISNNAFAILFNQYMQENLWVYSLYNLLVYGGMIYMLWFLLRHFPEILAQLRSETSLGKMLSQFFTSLGVILVLILFLGITVLNLE